MAVEGIFKSPDDERHEEAYYKELESKQIEAMRKLVYISWYNNNLSEDHLNAFGNLSRGLKAFENEDFTTAVKQLHKYVEINDDDDFARYYLAVSQFSVNDYAAAIKNLNQLKDAEDVKLRGDVRWYLALGYTMVEDNSVNVCKMFESIANDLSSDWNKEAKAFKSYIGCEDIGVSK